jgi:hypothetical protein
MGPPVRRGSPGYRRDERSDAPPDPGTLLASRDVGDPLPNPLLRLLEVDSDTTRGGGYQIQERGSAQ